MATLTEKVVYPTSDGKPMAETGIHVDAIIETVEILRWRFPSEDVYIGANCFLYYERGNPRKCLAPDTFLVFGIPRQPPRDCYMVWKEGKSPDVIFEMTSGSTKREDQSKKYRIYEALKVREYILFDPLGDYLKPRLQGHRLVGDNYQPILVEGGRIFSEVLGLRMEAEGQRLYFIDPATGKRLPTPREAADQSKAEVQRLQAELERLRPKHQ